MSDKTDPKGAASRKRASFWLKTRKVVQLLALAVFCLLFLISRPGETAQGLIDLIFRFDPLVTINTMLASRAFLIDSAIGLGLSLLLAIIVGRAWCGWLCPMGTILDWFNFKKKNYPALPDSLRGGKYGLLLLILFAALMGNLTLLLFDPITIVYRTLSFSLLPGLNQLVTMLEQALYPIEIFQPGISWLESALRPSILPDTPQYFNQSFLFGFVFVGTILLNALAPRFWCRYLCPLGGLLGLISKISIFRREVDSTCRECGLCSRRCPMATINPAKGYASDPAECIVCLECFPGCGESSIRAATPLKPAAWNQYDPGRRALLDMFGVALVSVAGVSFFKSEGNQIRPNTYALRPPGATSDKLLSACTRCGVCMHACPTNALQPAGLGFGLESVWTPVIIPREGYCEYSCNTCGQVCPVHAIPDLSLEEKRTRIIGKAYIDQNRCLAWSDHRDCIVCEEMCPIPEKAIKITDLNVLDTDGQKRTIKAPYIDRELCIGCGTCEFKCPVGGESAIRVHVANPDTLY